VTCDYKCFKIPNGASFEYIAICAHCFIATGVIKYRNANGDCKEIKKEGMKEPELVFEIATRQSKDFA
jgi:hypothetical protein